jgi:hypothetical protein
MSLAFSPEVLFAPAPIQTLHRFEQLSRVYLAWKAGEDGPISDDGKIAPAGLTPELAAWYVLHRLNLAPGDVADIQRRLAQAVVSGGEAELQTMTYIADATLYRMHRHMRASAPRIVSLGELCLPRTLAAKWGFKPSRQMGEGTMPFDLAIHAGASVLRYLRTDFSDYLDESRIAFREDLNYPVNERDGVHWNHEVGADWAENGLHRFKTAYLRRIGHFRDAIRAERCLCFYYSENTYRPDLTRALAEAVAKIRDGRPATLFVVYGGHAQFEESEQTIDGVRMRSLLMPMPFKDYVWFWESHYTTAAGHRWERLIVDRLAELVDGG